MKRRLAITALAGAILVLGSPLPRARANDDFGAVVRAIEQFYHVKHQNLPLLARAAITTTRTAAKIRGGEAKRIAQAGSARVVFFEDQEFDSRGRIATFKASLENTLKDAWSPLVETLAAKEEEQTYIYVREAGQRFNVLVVTIERHEATVVQVTVAPEVLATLLKDPNEMGRAITSDATINDN